MRDLRLLDGARAELARVLAMDITSYDTGPAADPSPIASPPDGQRVELTVQPGDNDLGKIELGEALFNK